MKPKHLASNLLAATLMFLCLVPTAFAHRLDELLQATILSVEIGHLRASMRLIPGIALSSSVIAQIDTNGDGIFSGPEQQAYSNRVLEDLSLSIDGTPLRPTLVSAEFPTPALMREGLGEIHLVFTANLPPGGRERSLVLSQRPQPRAAYLVNTTVPTTQAIQILAQHRNEDQSVYRLDYLDTGVAATPAPVSWFSALRFDVGAGLAASSFASLYRLGMRHIAEGTDHLLFLLALLLPAPLLVSGTRWAQAASLRSCLVRILKVVTAFTIGHSITLALAAWGIVSVPARPVEVLIAISVLVSAAHAFRPIFPGNEAFIAGFFGLVHGLAFAATLSGLALAPWQRLFGILAFNLGIETMQLLVIALVMPALVLASRTRAYPALRTAGALLTGFAAVAWIAERLSNA